MKKKLVLRCSIEGLTHALTVVKFDPDSPSRVHLWTTHAPAEGVVLSRKDMKRLRDHLNDMLERDA